MIKLNIPSSWKIFPALMMILVFSAFSAKAQSLSEISVRFTNPTFDCPTQIYCVDVEIQSDTPGDTLFGMNVRFFYDDNILEYSSVDSFATGYNLLAPPQVLTGSGGSFFGFSGPPEWFNGQVQLVGPTNVELPVGQWVRLFKICFHVDDPASINIESFCPSIVWDLQQDPPEFGGGFLPGDDGVVITVLAPSPGQTYPVIEIVIQYNWQYSDGGDTFGFPVNTTCISTDCWEVPLSNWSLLLAIGLMVVATAVIVRRRI